MFKPKQLLLAVIAMPLLLFSCSKGQSGDPTVPGPYASVQDVFNSLALQPKIVSIDATAGGTVFGNSGTRYIFTGGAFMNASGATVGGMIDIKVVEYLKKGDMLFSKFIPVSNGDPLVSGGEINVQASQGGQPVFLKPYYTFEARIPTSGTPPGGMGLFTGQPVLDTTLVKANWRPAKRDSAQYNVGVFALPGGDTLRIVSDSMVLCNADQFLSTPNYQSFYVSVKADGATLPATDVIGYTLYDQYKGVWPFFHFSNGTFSEAHVPNIPVHFVVFTVIDGKFYGGILGVTPATGSTYTITITAQDPVVFKQNLNNL